MTNGIILYVLYYLSVSNFISQKFRVGSPWAILLFWAGEGEQVANLRIFRVLKINNSEKISHTNFSRCYSLLTDNSFWGKKKWVMSVQWIIFCNLFDKIICSQTINALMLTLQLIGKVNSLALVFKRIGRCPNTVQWPAAYWCITCYLY